MKPNNPAIFQNRVAQFEKQEKLNREADTLRKRSGVSKKIKALDTSNPYLQARLKVLEGYGKDRLKQIQECEQNGTLDTREYQRFIFDILTVAGDIPTHDLRNKTETCGCFSCQIRDSR